MVLTALQKARLRASSRWNRSSGWGKALLIAGLIILGMMALSCLTLFLGYKTARGLSTNPRNLDFYLPRATGLARSRRQRAIR